jgi:hypothetical protein
MTRAARSLPLFLYALDPFAPVVEAPIIVFKNAPLAATPTPFA